MVDTRKWLLSKLLPKQYGDRLEVNATVSRDPGELTDMELMRLAAEGLSAIEQGNPRLLEHDSNPTHTLTHDNTPASGNGADRPPSGASKSHKLY
jgi:hypothetical protein